MIFQFYPTSLLWSFIDKYSASLLRTSKSVLKMKSPSVRFYYDVLLFIRHKIPIALETNLCRIQSQKSYSLSFTAWGSLWFTTCTYICAGNEKARSNTASKSWNHLWDWSNGAFEIQLDLVFLLLFQGGLSKTWAPHLWPLGFRLTGSAGQDGEKTRAWKCSVKWFYHWLTRITEMLLEELLKSLAVCFWANLSLVTLFSVSFPLLSSHTNSILIYIYLVM